MGNKKSTINAVEISKEEDWIETKKENVLKNRGLDALSGSLKDAFLREEDSDVTINVGDQKYAAHTFILKHRSPVFKAMLTHEMLEKNQRCVNISDCDPSVFRNFLFYLYTGKLDNLSKDNMIELYCVSDKYDVKELKIECVDLILNNLNSNNICDVITLAVKYEEQNILSGAIKFFVNNVNDILTTPNWQTFLTENPIQANELIIKAFNNDSKK